MTSRASAPSGSRQAERLAVDSCTAGTAQGESLRRVRTSGVAVAQALVRNRAGHAGAFKLIDALCVRQALGQIVVRGELVAAGAVSKRKQSCSTVSEIVLCTCIDEL